MLNGIDIALGQNDDSISTSIGGKGYEEEQIFYRFYSPDGKLINEIPTPAYRIYGEISLCSAYFGGLCIWEATSEQAGTCTANDIIPLNAHEVIASERTCQEGDYTGTLSMWRN